MYNIKKFKYRLKQTNLFKGQISQLKVKAIGKSDFNYWFKSIFDIGFMRKVEYLWTPLSHWNNPFSIRVGGGWFFDRFILLPPSVLIVWSARILNWDFGTSIWIIDVLAEGISTSFVEFQNSRAAPDCASWILTPFQTKTFRNNLYTENWRPWS